MGIGKAKEQKIGQVVGKEGRGGVRRGGERRRRRRSTEDEEEEKKGGK